MNENEKLYHSALSRCAELLSNMPDGDPLTDVPMYLTAKLDQMRRAGAAREGGNTSIEGLNRYEAYNGAEGPFMCANPSGEYLKFSEVSAHLSSRSQAAQPSIDTPEFMDALCAFYEQASCEDFDKNAYDAARKAVTTHLAGQSQATRAAKQAVALFEQMLEAEFGKPGWPSVYDVEQCIKALKGSTAQQVTQQAAPETSALDLQNDIDMVTGALDLCEPEDQQAFQRILVAAKGGNRG